LSSEKIPSLKYSVSITLFSMVIIPIVWWLFLDFPMNKLSEDTARKLSQLGVYINLVAALSMIVRYLWLKRYKRRLLHIYKLDEAIVSKHEHMSHHTFDQNTKDESSDLLKNEQKPLYQELSNFYAFDKVESLHMVIGISGLFIGSFFQMVAAGALTSQVI
jgi:ABC-type multidrug transport system fused ATPase/permease subunit